MGKKNSLSDKVTNRYQQNQMVDEEGKPTFLYYERDIKKKVKELIDRFDSDCDNWDDKSVLLVNLVEEIFGKRITP